MNMQLLKIGCRVINLAAIKQLVIGQAEKYDIDGFDIGTPAVRIDFGNSISSDIWDLILTDEDAEILIAYLKDNIYNAV